MIETLTSSPAVAAVALATAALFTRDMWEGERLRGSGNTSGRDPGSSGLGGEGAPRLRSRWYGFACLSVLLVLVVLRFVALAG